jgi:DNA repair protein SbcC/Rad50
MKIKRIKAVGIKGGDFEHELGGVTLVSGKNFTGKTARLEAVRLALMGYLPELGKANGATMGLARNGSLQVEAEFNDGRSIWRSWNRSKTGVKAEAGLAGFPDTPAVLIDPAAYFTLGDKDRVRYVFGLINVEEKVNADTVISEIKNIRLAENTEETERVIRELVDWVDESDRARHDAGAPVQDWLEEIVAGAREKLKFARQNADRIAKTVQGLTQMQAADVMTEDVSEAMEKVRVYLAELQAKKNSGAARAKERHQTEQTLNDLAANIAKLERESADIPALEKELSELRAFPFTVVDLQKLALQWREAQKRLNQVEVDYGFTAKRANTLRKEIEEIDRLIACPTCKCKGKGWKKNILGTREDERNEAIALLNDLVKRQDEAAREVALVTEQMDKAREIEAKSRDHQSRVAKTEALLQLANRNKDELERARKMHANLSHKLFGLASLAADEGTNLDTNIEVARKGLQELEDAQRKADMAKAEGMRRAQAILESQALEAEVKVLGEAVKVLERLQVKLVEESFKEILGKANRLTGGILPSLLEYKDGEIGRWNGGTWVSHKAFSGTEKALAYAAISVALAADAPCKIVMIDELGRLDTDNAKRLIERVAELISEGVIDQFIGVGPSNMWVWTSDEHAKLIEI